MLVARTTRPNQDVEVKLPPTAKDHQGKKRRAEEETERDGEQKGGNRWSERAFPQWVQQTQSISLSRPHGRHCSR